MVFSAVSKVSSTEVEYDTDDSVSAGWEKNGRTLHRAILMQLDLE